MVKITLDAETFKALASSTRLTVLRALDERRKTLTELARDLNLNKATIHEHLQLLSAADLIRKRDDEGRKWIYYELTWRGQRLLHPQETTTFNVLLGLSMLAAGGGVAMLGRALGWWLQTATPASTADDMGPQALASPSGAGPESDNTTQGGATSGTASGTAAPPSDPGGAQPAFDGQEAKQAAPPAGEPQGFFEDGGTLGLVLMLMTLLFTTLAFVLRRKVQPGRFNAKAAAAAEASGAPTGPPASPGSGDAPRRP